MKAIIKNNLEFTLDTVGVNKLILDQTVTGGSDVEFIPEDTVDPTGDQFTILDVEKKVFELESGTTFNKDLLSLISTPLTDITGIMVSAYQVVDGKTTTPIRFKTSLKLTTMVSEVDMGSLSNLSLLNFFPNKVEKLVVSDLVIPTAMIANLVVVVLSKTKIS